MGYLANFIVYTLAMVGVIAVALMVFKFSANGSNKGSSKILKIHDTLSLGPRKTLYIVSAGEEKFLIAGDVDKTNLISKLDTKNKTENYQQPEIFKETLENIPTKTSYIDRNIIGNYDTRTKSGVSVMKNIAERIKQ